MTKHSFIWYLLLAAVGLFLLAGCGKEKSDRASVLAASTIQADSEALNNVSVTLPEGMTRETISDIQHDFIREGKQVGGIVIVDISNEMLDSPRGDNLLKITGILGKQLMPQEDPDDIEFMCAGGNDFAYLEIYTGDDQIRYVHYLFRGEAYSYDVWFACDLVDQGTISDILATVSADDISAELNESVV